MPTKKVCSRWFLGRHLTSVSTIGYVRTYIILPSTIYGVATGKLVELGIQNPYSIQMPALINASIDRRQAGMVGRGKNVWPNVYIDDSMYQVSVDLLFNKPRI